MLKNVSHKHTRSHKQILTQVFPPPAGARGGTRGLWKTHVSFGASFLSPRLPSAWAAARAGAWESWARPAAIRRKACVFLIYTVKYTVHSEASCTGTLISLSIKTRERNQQCVCVCVCVCVCGGGGGGVEQQLVDMMEICRFIHLLMYYDGQNIDFSTCLKSNKKIHMNWFN